MSSDDDSYDSDEPLSLVLDLNEFIQRASLAVSRKCIDSRKMTRGRYHEIFTLFFEDGKQEKEWSCIARAVMDDHVHGSRIPSIAIQLRSIEEIFCQTWMDQD